MPNSQGSVAEGLGKAHAALIKILRELHDTAARSSGRDRAALQACLKSTQAHIREHFRCEEQDGYLEQVRKREPRLGHAIEQLAAEHLQLLQSLESLIADFDRSATPALRQAVDDWIQEVHAHEARENDLVQDAYNLDSNAED